VEFGAGNGVGLPVLCGPLVDAGWSARLIEADGESAKSLAARYPTANVVAETVTPNTIELVDNAFDKPATLVVVDVDGDDIVLAGAMKARPAIVVVEHWDEADDDNPRKPARPSEAGTRNTENFTRQANSLAVSEVMAGAGYVPVWVGRVNGVYVRNDLAVRLARKQGESGCKPLRLNIGGGDTQIDGFTNVDRKLGTEAFPLANADNSVDEIRAVHILEHFPRAKTQAVLNDWVRAMKPGARIRVSVPDIAKIAEQLKNPTLPVDLEGIIYGGQTDANDFHHAAFDEAGLAVMLARAGLIAIQPWNDDVRDNNLHPISLNLEGYKPTENMRDAAYMRKIVGVQSVPRLTFTESESCVKKIQRSLGIDVHVMQGAFWGQCLERGFVRAIESGAEWILAFDYDTVFSLADVQKLCLLLESHPEVDAIAPLQMKRGDNTALLNVEKGTGDLSLLRGPLLDVTLAHFGCTLIRVSALKKMAHPWFWGQPNSDGQWGEGREDEDIYFWRKFREAGNRVCVAPRVSVGHLQLIVTWPDEWLRPIWQHTRDWIENGPPAERRH
jgi:hypothetical protein